MGRYTLLRGKPATMPMQNGTPGYPEKPVAAIALIAKRNCRIPNRKV